MYLMPVNITQKLKPKNMKKWTPTTNVKRAVGAAADIDWCDSTHNLCTPVKDQGQCGSCWAFSATQTIESANAAAGNGLNTLAPQQIVDCDSADAGCGGGDPRSGMSYIQGAPSQEGESSYPYTSGQSGQAGQCAFDSSETVEDDQNGPVDVSDGDESKLISFLESTGPPSVCVDASSWQTYQSGVMSKCGCNIDHAVQAVGIQTVNGVSAYKVRNSWNTDWGVDGFIFLKVGGNTCCVANEVSWASV
jgi:C1A family cysteine protease